MGMSRTGRGKNPTPGRPPPPKCDACRRNLRPASATEWKCGNTECSEYDLPVNTGVYPSGG
jgi:hypothetical protein